MGVAFPHSGVELTADSVGSGEALDLGEQNETTRIHHNNSSFRRRTDAWPGGIGKR